MLQKKVARMPGWCASARRKLVAESETLSDSTVGWTLPGSSKRRSKRTDRYKPIHWVNRGNDSELDEFYDLEKNP